MRTGIAVAALALIMATCHDAPQQSGSAARSPTPSPTAPAPAPASRKQLRHPVLVYQLQKGGDGYRLGAYAPVSRSSRGASGVGERLQVALRELVEGPTHAERRIGFSSAFGKDTAGVLLRVEVRGNRAVVDFRDFRRKRPEWGASYGGAVFLTQLNLTVFQFERIDSALYRIETSCRKFSAFLQVGQCRPIRATRALRGERRR